MQIIALLFITYIRNWRSFCLQLSILKQVLCFTWHLKLELGHINFKSPKSLFYFFRYIYVFSKYILKTILCVFSNTFLSKVILKSYPQEKSFVIPFSHVFENNLSILYLSVHDVQKILSVSNRINFEDEGFYQFQK